MGESAASLDATPDAFGRASFAMMDILRRALGHALGAFGLDPDECTYHIVGFGPHWSLRDYGGHNTSLSLLIVTAPIKRAYIWDLAPSVSAVRYCMRAGLHVHLLEWLPASDRGARSPTHVRYDADRPQSEGHGATDAVTVDGDLGLGGNCRNDCGISCAFHSAIG